MGSATPMMSTSSGCFSAKPPYTLPRPPAPSVMAVIGLASLRWRGSLGIEYSYTLSLTFEKASNPKVAPPNVRPKFRSAFLLFILFKFQNGFYRQMVRRIGFVDHLVIDYI